MNLNTEGEKVPIELDPEVASRVTHLCREFEIQDESELLEWMVRELEWDLRQKRDGRKVLVTELTSLGEDHGSEDRIARGYNFWDRREEIRVTVKLESRSRMGHLKRWYATVEALPDFPEGPFIPGGPLIVWGRVSQSRAGPEGVTVFLTLRYSPHAVPSFVASNGSVTLVFESLSAAALEDVRSRIGDEFILERSVEEIEDLPFDEPGDGIPRTPARVLPPDFDFEDAEA